MTVFQALLLFGGAMLGGGLNAVAGGGSFVSFPMLTFLGVPGTNASATNTMALWPGSVASVGAYRRELRQQDRAQAIMLILICLAGGSLGSILLLVTPEQVFTNMIPFLLLLATCLFAFGGNLTRALRERMNRKDSEGNTLDKPNFVGLLGIAYLQLAISIYGGYFGAGIGIMMLAVLTLMGMENIHIMNGLKTLLASFINGMSIIIFIFGGVIYWPQAVIMIIGAIVGGYGGAALALKLDPKLVRRFVLVVAVTMTLIYFARTFLK